MKRSIQFPLLPLAMAVLAGCSNAPTREYSAWMAQKATAEANRQAALAEAVKSCQTDLCRVMLLKQPAPATRVAPPQPTWVKAINALTPWARIISGAYTHKITSEQNTELWSTVVGSLTTMDRSDQSTTITVGGNYGDTDMSDNSLSVGGNYGDTDSSVTYGDGSVTGDGNTVGDGNAGGDMFGDNGNNSGEIRIDSSGPVDSSNSGNDSSDNSVTNPPPPPPAP